LKKISVPSLVVIAGMSLILFADWKLNVFDMERLRRLSDKADFQS
jgi:hypothetical protein